MNDSHPPDPDLELVEAVYDALDQGRAARAHELALRAIADGADEDPVLHLLAGVALLEMDRPEDAVAPLLRAVELDPEDAELRSRLAEALYGSCNFDAAAREARAAVECDAGLPHGHWMAGLLLERSGAFEQADAELAAAAELAPEEFPPPFRLSPEDFDRHLALAIEELPEPFRRHLDEVTVGVEELPPDEILLAENPPLDPELLGLFIGVPVSENSVFAPGGELPPRILLFKRNIERFASSEDELRDEIGVTLRHELGHYLGLDEDEIERAGHA